MSLLVDIEKDTFYIQGVQKGKQEGIQEGKQEGIQEGKLVYQRRTIINLISKLGLDDKSIAELTEAPIKLVRAIRKELK